VITAIPGWRTIHEAGLIELVHPAGRAVATIEYRERVRPLGRIGTLVREHLAAEPQFTAHAIPDGAERLVTNEGEHAALVTVRGQERGAPAQRDLGFVFGDDFYAAIFGQCFEEARFAELTAKVRGLVLADSHALGVRRRRFEYTPPPDWEPIIENLVTDWYPPGYPSDGVILSVYAANPRKVEPNAVFHGLIRELALAGNHVSVEGDPTPARASAGLAGSILTVTLRRSVAGATTAVKKLALLQDPRYSYGLELSARSAAELAAHPGLLDAVVASVKPIPEPGGGARDQSFAAYWME
jgi:hypothetical protein